MNEQDSAQTRQSSNGSLDASVNEHGWELVSSQVRRVKTITIDGAELAYTERGKGEPVILVHGALSDYRTWSPQLNSLAARYHVISYSRRYHHTDAPNVGVSDYTHRRHVDDLIALIEALQLGPVHLVGSSRESQVQGSMEPSAVNSAIACHIHNF